MLAKPFQPALPILTKLENAGFTAYFVGGCVRDLFIGRDIHDIDIATSAAPEKVQDLFDKVIPVGIEHGTVIVRHDYESYEVTTYRTEGIYTDKRRPDSVNFIDNIEEDLKRRDFTINALAMDKNGNVLDLFKGQSDLRQQLIRTVGDGKERFHEDALRILRALRFSSQLGFAIESSTLEAMKSMKHEIKSLAVERIASEIEKWAAGSHLNFSFQYLKNLKIDQELPVLKNHAGMLDRFPKTVHPLPTFAAFIAYCHLLNESISTSEWASSWKCSNKTKREATALVEAWQNLQENGLNAKLVYRLGDELDDSLLAINHNFPSGKSLSLTEIDQLRKALPIRTKNDLALKGEEIIALFPNQQKGRWIHELIVTMEQAVVEGNARNTKNDLKEWIKWNPPVIN